MHEDLPSPPLTWLEPGQDFPPLDRAWPRHSPAPGLLAASADLDAPQLLKAYRHGIFPWFSERQPVLWWSPDPRMVLRPPAFRFHRPLRQALKQRLSVTGAELVFNRDFAQVIRQCADTPRPGQNGTWIGPAIIAAYSELHRQGLAHSAELWQEGRLLAGLYFVALGHAIYGESMFTTVRDGSKLALCLLVSVARHHRVPLIDCQQNTPHLASLGAVEMSREGFMREMTTAQQGPVIDWSGERLYWNELLQGRP